jgi:two-component sensor histidine kinase
MTPISALRSRAEMLQVAELLHRIGNDYTRVIAFASLRAANASSNEARSALSEVVNHLHAAVEMYRVLRPPSVAGSADLTDTIARLCRAQSDVSEFRRRRIDLLLAYDDPIELDSWRCWHASLIVAELINNACRHALGSTSGLISVGRRPCARLRTGSLKPITSPRRASLMRLPSWRGCCALDQPQRQRAASVLNPFVTRA